MDIHGKIKQWEHEDGVRLIQEFGLPQDARILDYGCGFGHYSLAASRSLGDGQGKVYAVDINKDCLKHVARVAADEGLTNIEVASGNPDYRLNYPEAFFDLILYYDLLHGEGFHRFTLWEEAARTLKPQAVLSILPFHLSNFRDREGKKKTFTYAKLEAEAKEYGFVTLAAKPIGLHFEKYHSKYYIDKGGLAFEDLEKAPTLNFVKQVENT